MQETSLLLPSNTTETTSVRNLIGCRLRNVCSTSLGKWDAYQPELEPRIWLGATRFRVQEFFQEGDGHSQSSAFYIPDFYGKIVDFSNVLNDRKTNTSAWRRRVEANSAFHHHRQVFRTDTMLINARL
ncbi:hypothetical protein R6X40_20125 [Rhizobium sp. PL01]|nr:hypothetical protein [Rhizobium sp. PL01]MDW5316420.1 hypothetical protein [Rhizobium sp. PL01]